MVGAVIAIAVPMRSLPVALLVLLAPCAAHPQTAPRSLALEIGLSSDSVESVGARIPFALFASLWLLGDLDATARLAFGAGARTDDRAADACVEAGLGLRWGLGRWSVLRPQLLVGASYVELTGGGRLLSESSGMRLRAGAALEAFVARDASLAVSAEATQLTLAGFRGGPGAQVSLRAAAYF